MLRVMLCVFGKKNKNKYITEVMLCFYCSLSNIAQFWFVPLLRMFTLVKWLMLYLLGISIVKILFLVKLIHILWCGTLKLHISCFIIKIFLYSFIYFHRVCTRGFQFHSLHSNPLLSFFILMLKLSKFWPVGAPSSRLFGVCPSFM